MGSGCVPLASEACTEICDHMKTGLMHKIGDVEALTQHITLLHENRALLEQFRAACLAAAPNITWTAAGRVLLDAYRETIAPHKTGALHESTLA
jgi:glycosyltransferase involved in cell wall biosynthesis